MMECNIPKPLLSQIYVTKPIVSAGTLIRSQIIILDIYGNVVPFLHDNCDAFNFLSSTIVYTEKANAHKISIELLKEVDSPSQIKQILHAKTIVWGR